MTDCIDGANGVATSTRTRVKSATTGNRVSAWGLHVTCDDETGLVGTDAHQPTLFGIEASCAVRGLDDLTARRGLGRRAVIVCIAKGHKGVSPAPNPADTNHQTGMGIYIQHGVTNFDTWGYFKRGIAIEDVIGINRMRALSLTPRAMEFGIDVATTGNTAILIHRGSQWADFDPSTDLLIGDRADFGLRIEDSYKTAAIRIPAGERFDLGLFSGDPVSLVLAGGIVKLFLAGVEKTSFNATTGRISVQGTQVVSNQQTAVANATDAASAITQLNLLLARLRNHGLIAS